ncbi:MAG TPA: hypothetical protein VG125_05040, partial [Pirellulales bacterium]|nr:hypothetical protein [Pirellulales bacterium]
GWRRLYRLNHYGSAEYRTFPTVECVKPEPAKIDEKRWATSTHRPSRRDSGNFGQCAAGNNGKYGT